MMHQLIWLVVHAVDGRRFLTKPPQQLNDQSQEGDSAQIEPTAPRSPFLEDAVCSHISDSFTVGADPSVEHADAYCFILSEACNVPCGVAHEEYSVVNPAHYVDAAENILGPLELFHQLRQEDDTFCEDLHDAIDQHLFETPDHLEDVCIFVEKICLDGHPAACPEQVEYAGDISTVDDVICDRLRHELSDVGGGETVVDTIHCQVLEAVCGDTCEASSASGGLPSATIQRMVSVGELYRIMMADSTVCPILLADPPTDAHSGTLRMIADFVCSE